MDALITQTAQPQFVDSAYFLKFKFEAGSTRSSGGRQFEGRDVLRIEYYPAKLFDVDGSEDKRKQTQDKPRDPKSKGASSRRRSIS